jgi:formylmethanofuran dehydrogenase subunit D
MIRTTKLWTALVAVLVTSATTLAQVDPPWEQEVVIRFDSGRVVNQADERAVVFSHVVHVPEAPWVRLMLDQATLGTAPVGGEPTVLMITSLEDGAVQVLDAQEIQQWQYSSAYFNGDMVLIEVVADPGATPSRVRSTRMLAGPPSPVQQASICGPTDDRVPSSDPRVARIWPNGCTAFLIDDELNCFLTAGHCATFSFEIVEFNVPLSDANGAANHPPPSDQYPIDPASLQTLGSGGVGNDWAYFGAFANSETGLTAAQAQGAFFVLADTPPPVQGQTIRITGCGTTGSSVPGEWNRAQKTHTGPFVTFAGSTVQYQTDTTGGNSGSPVINEDTGQVIGIHTHGGCGSSSGENSGTGINNAALQDALANPQGVCLPLGPANDDCGSALLADVGLTPFTTVGSSTDGLDEDGTCGFGGVNHLQNDVWFRYFALCDGTLEVSLTDLDFPAEVAVYLGLGCPDGPGQAVACIASPGDGTALIPVTAAQPVRIRIGGAGGVTGSGNLLLNCDAPVPCPGDCAQPSDGTVNVIDLLAMLSQWGQPGSCAFTGENEIVDVNDLITLLGLYGTDCP